MTGEKDGAWILFGCVSFGWRLSRHLKGGPGFFFFALLALRVYDTRPFSCLLSCGS
jgi:hypothetical protein